MRRIKIMSETLDEMVHHPKHYNTHPSGVECIDLIEWLPCNTSNVVKYLWRKDDKHDKEVQDCEKALWYLHREIDRIRGYTPLDRPGDVPDEVQEKYECWREHEPEGVRRFVIEACWSGFLWDLLIALDVLEKYIAEMEQK